MLTNRCRSVAFALAAALAAGRAPRRRPRGRRRPPHAQRHRQQDQRAGGLPPAPGRAGQEGAEGRAAPLLVRPFRLSRHRRAQIAAGQVHIRVAARAGILHRQRQLQDQPLRRGLQGRGPAALRRPDDRRLVLRRPLRAAAGPRRGTAHVGRRPARRRVRHLVERQGRRPRRCGEEEEGDRKEQGDGEGEAAGVGRSPIRWSCFDKDRCYQALAGGFPAPAPSCSTSISPPPCGSRWAKGNIRRK